MKNKPALELIEDLYVDHYSYLKNYLMKLTKNEDDANEIIQELFSRLLSNPQKIRNVHYQKSWLVACARNILIDKYRKLRPTLLKDEKNIENILIERYTPESIAEVNYEINTLLNTLNNSDKAILLAREYYGYSYEELSDLFNMTVSNLKSKIFRIKRRLLKHRGESNE